MGGFWTDESGLTLLEVVVALVLISLITTAFVPMIASSVKFINRAWERYQYYTEARSQMEIQMAKAAQGVAVGRSAKFPIKPESESGPPVMVDGVTIEVGEEGKLVVFIPNKVNK